MTDLLIFLIIIIVTYGIGRPFFGLLIKNAKNNLEGFVFSTGIGLGILGYTVYIVGSLGFLYPGIMIAVLSAYAVFSLPSFVRLLRDIEWNKIMDVIARSTFFEKFLFSIIIIIPSICIFGAVAPEIGCDTLSYHIYHPKIFVQRHSVGYIPFTRESLWPYLTQMLFTLGLIFKSVPIAKLFHFFFGILSVFSVYFITRRLSDRKTALFAAALVYSAPGIFMQSVYSYVDLSLCFYSLAALYAAIRWMEKDELGLLILSGVFTGLAISVKLFGCFAFVALLMLIIFNMIRKRSGTHALIKYVLIFSVVSFLCSFIWYARSYAVLHNPVYPFLNTVFNSGFVCENVANYGLRKDIVGFIRLPWDLVMHSGRFGDEQIGIAALALLPFVFFIPSKDNRIKSLLIFFFIYLIQWFLVDQNARFAFTFFAIFYILAGVGFSRAMKLYRFNAVLLLVSLCMVFNVSLCAYYNRDAFKLAIRVMGREEYLTKKERTYLMAKFINENLPKDSKLIMVGEPKAYYFDRDVLMYDIWKAVSSGSMVGYMDELKKEGIPIYILYRSDADYQEIRDAIYGKKPIQVFSTDIDVIKPVEYRLYKI